MTATIAEGGAVAGEVSGAPSRAYTVAEAAALLSVSTAHLYRRLREDGAIAGVPGIRIGTSWRLPRHRIDALVAGE